MHTAVLVGLNLVAGRLLRRAAQRPGLLGYAKGGKWYLTWLAIGVITLMDELTSVFYAPGRGAPLHRHAGDLLHRLHVAPHARPLEPHGRDRADPRAATTSAAAASTRSRTSCSGRSSSFVAVASIMVDYILTACISTVSAVINGTAFLADRPAARVRCSSSRIIWGVAGLNILGIRENARVTFGIFIAAAFVFVNLIALGLLHIDPHEPGASSSAAPRDVVGDVDRRRAGARHRRSSPSASRAACSPTRASSPSSRPPAWSRAGATSRRPTGSSRSPSASSRRSSRRWRSRRRSTSRAHEGDLIPHWATLVGERAVRRRRRPPRQRHPRSWRSTPPTSRRASCSSASAHRYRFDWLLATNRRASLYRIHVLNALLYTAIILLTAGSQAILAEMYAIGLLASFCINIGCLLIYRYFQGTKEIRALLHVARRHARCSRLILVALLRLPGLPQAVRHGALGAASSACSSPAGIPFSRRYGPEVQEMRRSDYPMEMLLALGETDGPLHV